MTKMFLRPGDYPAYVVYAHRPLGGGDIFHIGSGTVGRALKPERSGAWRDHVGGRDVEVEILESHRCAARARLREAQLIHEHRPITNKHHLSGPHPRVVRGYTKRGVRCDCGPDCYGREAAAAERADPVRGRRVPKD